MEFCGFAAVDRSSVRRAPTAGSSTGAGYVDQLEIKGRYDAYNGQYFGYVGPYEVVYGIVHGKLDPRNPSNAGIVDLTLAPKDSQGMVDYSEDFVIFRRENSSATPSGSFGMRWSIEATSSI